VAAGGVGPVVEDVAEEVDVCACGERAVLVGCVWGSRGSGWG